MSENSTWPSSSLGPSEDLPPDCPDWVLTTVAAAAIAIAILGFWGNLLTMLALPYSRKLRNASTWFVVNLAATECLFCITILPLSAAHLLHLRNTGMELFSDDGCRAFVFLRYVNVQAELLSIAWVAVSRCILIVAPHLYKKIFRPAMTVVIIVSIWLVSVVLMLLPLLEVFGGFTYNTATYECDFDDATPYEKLPRKVFLLLGFMAPALIIIVSYIIIFIKARQSSMRFRHRKSAPAAFPPDQGGNSLRARPGTEFRSRDIRLALTIFVIFIVFLVCCTPVSVLHFVDEEGEYTTALLLLHPLYWMQYCLNIFIYVFMNKQYRDAYVNFISSWCPMFKDMSRERFMWTEENTSDARSRASRSLVSGSVRRLAMTNSRQSKLEQQQQGLVLYD